MKTRLLTLLLLVSFCRLPAQQPDITPETSASTETLHQWLNSGNPRLIAWAAYFAQQRPDPQILSELPARLERPFSVSSNSPTQAEQRRSTIAVLDSVIQRNIQLPVVVIAALANEFPAQAVILISRLPLTETRSTLIRWVEYDAQGSFEGQRLARIGAMLLALHPDSHIVARILEDSEEHLEIKVVQPRGLGLGFGSGMSCGDSNASLPPADWPPIYTYTLAENDPSSADNLEIVDVDGDRISGYRILDRNSAAPSCGVAPLNPETRHRLIAHWLGVEDQAMTWHANESASIVWTDMPEYLMHLGQIIQLHTQQLQATAEALHQRGLLDQEGGTFALPRLVVSVKCVIQPCPIAAIPGK